jgi:hypothetical protein
MLAIDVPSRAAGACDASPASCILSITYSEHGMQELRGSNPRSSTSFPRSDPDFWPSTAALKIV